MIRVPLSAIESNPFQTRTDTGDISSLARAILQARSDYPSTSGLIQVPPARLIDDQGNVVDPTSFDWEPGQNWPDGWTVQLAAGHRRLAAFRLLAEGLDGEPMPEYRTFPVDLALLDDRAMATTVWHENEARLDVNPIERALLIRRMQEALGLSQKEVADHLGLSPAAVSNSLRLLQLPGGIQDLLKKGEISERHGRALLPLLSLDVGEDVLLERVLKDLAGGFLPVAAVERRVRQEIEHRTGSLEEAPWPEDWRPEGSEMRTCEGCPERVKILREWRCKDTDCFWQKKHLYAIQVSGPEKARKLYPQHAWTADTPSWRGERCHCCGRQYGAEGGKWYRPGDRWNLWICPSCWEKAGLPGLPKPEEKSSEGGGEEIASAPVIHEPQQDEQPSATRVPEMRPISTPAASPSFPATLLTARILPGDELEDRRVMVSVAEEGRLPDRWMVGTYPQLLDLIRQAVDAYFGGNGHFSRENREQEAANGTDIPVR